MFDELRGDQPGPAIGDFAEFRLAFGDGLLEEINHAAAQWLGIILGGGFGFLQALEFFEIGAGSLGHADASVIALGPFRFLFSLLQVHRHNHVQKVRAGFH
jgi:hypothetical protein